MKFIAGVSSLNELSLSHFLDSRITVPMLKKFIQVRKWKDAKFHESELVGSDGKKLKEVPPENEEKLETHNDKMTILYGNGNAQTKYMCTMTI